MFHDRSHAGRLLGQALAGRYANAVLLAIPRGGAVIAHEVSQVIGAPWHFLMSRKIGAPFNPELAVGSVMQDGTVLLDEQVVKRLGISSIYIDKEACRQKAIIEKRLEEYAGNSVLPDLSGKTVIIVDDGIATGYTIRAAVVYLRTFKPSKVVVAVPVAPGDTVNEISRLVDEMVCLQTPEPFYAVGQFYENFEQVDDEEVKRLYRLQNKTHLTGG